MKQIQCLLYAVFFTSATHATDPAEVFQHLDQVKIESELAFTSSDIVEKQDQKLADGKILRWGFVYFDSEPLETIAAAPNQRGWVNFNVFPGLDFNVELLFETVLSRGSWHSLYGTSEIFATIAGPPPRVVTEPKKGQSPFPNSYWSYFSGRLYAGTLGNFEFFVVSGQPNLYVVEEADDSYTPDPSASDLEVPDGPGGGHGVSSSDAPEGGSTDIGREFAVAFPFGTSGSLSSPPYSRFTSSTT